MSRSVLAAGTAFFILFCWAPFLVADQIVLKNGNQISGKTTSLKDGKLTVETDYAEKIIIDWDHVAFLLADSPLYVSFVDGTTRKTRAVFYKAGYEDELPGGYQVSVEKIEAARVKGLSDEKQARVKITARVNAGLGNERGNTDTDDIFVDAGLTARTRYHRFRFSGELSNQKADGITTADSWLVFGEYNYFFSPKWFFYANSLFENNRFADLNLRTILSVGAGYQIFESDALNLSVASGPSYIDEDYIVAADDDYTAGQFMLNYNQTFLDRLFQLFHSNLAVIDFEDTDRRQIKTRQGIRFFLYRGLTATFQYNYDYNNNPSTEADSKWDSSLLFLLGYEFQN